MPKSGTGLENFFEKIDVVDLLTQGVPGLCVALVLCSLILLFFIANRKDPNERALRAVRKLGAGRQ